MMRAGTLQGAIIGKTNKEICNELMIRLTEHENLTFWFVDFRDVLANKSGERCLNTN